MTKYPARKARRICTIIGTGLALFFLLGTALALLSHGGDSGSEPNFMLQMDEAKAMGASPENAAGEGTNSQAKKHKWLDDDGVGMYWVGFY